MEDRLRGPVISRRGLAAGGAAALLARPALAQPQVAVVKSPDGRDVRLSVWPAQGRELGLIQFSHGAGSRPESYTRLIGPWTEAGFRIVAPLHVDSTDHPDHARLDPDDSWLYRLWDMRAVAQFCDRADYIAAGHSYGAQTALVLGGAEPVRPPRFTGPVADHLAKAVVAFSPPPPYRTLVTREGYGALAAPALIQTGTRDDLPAFLGGGDFHRHLIAYDVARGPDTYALVIEGVDHYFGNLICSPERPGPPQTAGFAVATRVSTDFLGAYGLADVGARARLEAALGAHPGFTLTRKTSAGETAPAPWAQPFAR